MMLTLISVNVQCDQGRTRGTNRKQRPSTLSARPRSETGSSGSARVKRGRPGNVTIWQSGELPGSFSPEIRREIEYIVFVNLIWPTP